MTCSSPASSSIFAVCPSAKCFSSPGWFAPTPGDITELVAYCSCGAKALNPQRLVDGKPAAYSSPIIMAGHFYEPRCDEHFVLPDRPH